jgi:mycofactocin glycosyltransferase
VTATGPAESALPLGFGVALDRRVRTLDDGAVLIGGAPPRLLRLSDAGKRLLANGRCTVTGRESGALVRRLLDAGIAHPVAEPASAVPAAAEVTVVVPVRDRAPELARLLAALPDGLGGLVVVDDGSTNEGAVRAVAEAGGATVLRHPSARGPAAARNAGLAVATTPFVAFLDSDVVPRPGWLAPLLACFADPAVGLAAPRIVALPPVEPLPPVGGLLAAYEAVRSSLDLGPDPALVVPRSRVAYVPSAALLVRRSAVGAGFDERMQVAEDVDLVLRLHEAGWRLRYEPSARVAHDHRTTFGAWWLRKAYYGTGAAPLAMRHRGSVPPMVLSPLSAAVGALTLVGTPRAAAAAVVVSAVAAERLSRKLPVRRPRQAAARLVAAGVVGAVAQTADAVTRHYWPVSLAACLLSRRARRTVLAVAVTEGVLDWWRHRGRDPAARPGLLGHLLAHRLDDLAYGSGLWWGALRHHTVEPLRPVGTGLATDRASANRRAPETAVRQG